MCVCIYIYVYIYKFSLKNGCELFLQNLRNPTFYDIKVSGVNMVLHYQVREFAMFLLMALGTVVRPGNDTDLNYVLFAETLYVIVRI